MRPPRLTLRQWVGYVGFAAVLILTAAVAVWRGELPPAWRDPQHALATYEPQIGRAHV